MDNTKKVQVQILNAFVDNDKGGNPAGVVLHADYLSHKEKLEIANQVGLSETAFVSHSEVADFKLDFFTPTQQIAHCGHATIATFSYLKQTGKVTASETSKETIDGKRKIKIMGDMAFMEQSPPRYTPIRTKEAPVLKSLGISPTDLIPEAPISLVNTGNSFVIIPVKDTTILKNIKPDFNRIHDLSDELDLIGYYVFAQKGEIKKSDATCRMFAPRYGIKEESGTGMAAGPLGAYLYDILHIKKEVFSISQGHFMDKPSPCLIQVGLQVENGAITSLMAGGKGVMKKQIEIEIKI